MEPSLFTPGGLLLLSSEPASAEQLHATIVRLFTDGKPGSLSAEEGGLVDCFAFALARILARVRTRQRQLAGEPLAFSSYELLAQLEEEFGCHPSPDDTIGQRQAALFAAGLAVLGSRRTALEQALRDALGDGYIGLHVANPATGEVSLWPSDLGDAPMLLADTSLPRKIASLPAGISTDLGVPQQVTYLPIDPSVLDRSTHTIFPGDSLLVQPENLGLCEKVLVSAVAFVGDNDGVGFTATFTKSHDDGCLVVAMPFPAWASSQRHLSVVLTEVAASNGAQREVAHRILARLVTGVTTWSLVASSGGMQAGPWTLDGSFRAKLDFNPMGLLPVP